MLLIKGTGNLDATNTCGFARDPPNENFIRRHAVCSCFVQGMYPNSGLGGDRLVILIFIK